MKFLTLVLSISFIVLIGNCSQQMASGNSNVNDSIFQSYGFPAHPNLTHLCTEYVYGLDNHITWDAFVSPAKPSELVDYYRRKLGDAGFTREGEGGSWRRPADATQPQAVMNIMAIGTDNPSRNCKKKPPSDSRAIIIISRMNKR